MAQDSQHNRSKINDSTDTDTGPSLGSYLQRERIKKQFSLEEIAEQTCINIGTLRAIESNDRSKMPAEVFSRGFIKLYAKFLGIDQQEVLERYDREMGQSDEENIRNHDVFYNEKLAESSSFLSLRKIFFLLILLALFALGYYFFLYSESPTSRRSSFFQGSGNRSLSSQINEKFETVQTPVQNHYASPSATGNSYSSPTSPSAGKPSSYNADSNADSQNQETTSFNNNNDQTLPQSVSPQAGEASTEISPAAGIENQEAPPPAR
ncbi:MAG: helix-turn-helix domain-containing protein [Proteobacteria bacterium]|nr:helix-turn-helix domain-containing protein [Pseudomonadota bacterium]MBU0964802.1 helix-turn-helix domain-containing protein [Pseudomonadota bacterium]